MEASPKTKQETLCRMSLRMTVAAALLTLTACAAQRPFHFAPSSISKIRYDPNSCTQLQDGTFKCTDVIITVSSVQAPVAK